MLFIYNGRIFCWAIWFLPCGIQVNQWYIYQRCAAWNGCPWNYIHPRELRASEIKVHQLETQPCIWKNTDGHHQLRLPTPWPMSAAIDFKALPAPGCVGNGMFANVVKYVDIYFFWSTATSASALDSFPSPAPQCIASLEQRLLGFNVWQGLLPPKEIKCQTVDNICIYICIHAFDDIRQHMYEKNVQLDCYQVRMKGGDATTQTSNCRFYPAAIFPTIWCRLPALLVVGSAIL